MGVPPNHPFGDFGNLGVSSFRETPYVFDCFLLNVERQCAVGEESGHRLSERPSTIERGLDPRQIWADHLWQCQGLDLPCLRGKR